MELVGQWDPAEVIWRKNLAESRQTAAAQGIVHNILQLTKLLQHRGRYSEVRALLEEAQALCRRHPDGKAAGQILAGLGVILYRQGDHAGAMELYGQALDICRSADFAEGLSTVYNNIGVIHEGRAEYQKAGEYFHLKLAIDQRTNNRRGISSAYNNIGICRLHQEDFAKAREIFLSKLENDRTIGNKAGIATALSNLGIVHRNLGEYDQAVECYQRTREIHLEMGDPRGLGIAENNLGNVYKAQGKHQQALKCYQSALAVAEAQGDRRDIAIYTGNIGQIHHHWTHDHPLALKHYNRAIEVLDELQQFYHLSEYLLHRAQLHLDMGHHDDAAAEEKHIMTAAAKAGREDIDFLARILEARLLALSDPQAAIGRLESLAEQAGDENLRTEALYWLALTSGREPYLGRALQHLRNLYASGPDHDLEVRIATLQKLAGEGPSPTAQE